MGGSPATGHPADGSSPGRGQGDPLRPVFGVLGGMAAVPAAAALAAAGWQHVCASLGPDWLRWGWQALALVVPLASALGFLAGFRGAAAAVDRLRGRGVRPGWTAAALAGSAIGLLLLAALLHRVGEAG